MRIGKHYSQYFRVKGLDHLSTFELYIILSLLLLKCGDVELNPGPNSNTFSSSVSSAVTLNETELANKFSIVHYNIQSISNKKDLLEAKLSNFDVICLTETWLDQRTADNAIKFNGYTTYRRDRVVDPHGGICVYVKHYFFSKRRSDLELLDVECVWVELSVHNRKIVIGTFYRPPNSTPSILPSIVNSIGLAFDTNVRDIIITGEFNLDMLSDRSSKKIKSICQEYNLQQLINDPRHFPGTSLIDPFLTLNPNNVTLSGNGEPFLDQNIRYHCPIYCILKFDKHQTKTFTRHIWLFERGIYRSLSQDISNTNWERLKSNDMNTYANKVTQHPTETAGKHIPNKYVKLRNSDPCWLNTSIKKLMRKRKKGFMINIKELKVVLTL